MRWLAFGQRIGLSVRSRVDFTLSAGFRVALRRREHDEDATGHSSGLGKRLDEDRNVSNRASSSLRANTVSPSRRPKGLAGNF
jgi:hypothetical protein